jgi:hypothetical protein
MRAQPSRAVEAVSWVVVVTMLMGIAAVMLPGCEQQSKQGARFSTGVGGGAPLEAPAASPTYAEGEMREAGGRVKQGEAAEKRAALGSEEVQEPGAQAVPRRIKYTADLRLIVENFDPVPNRVAQLAKAHHGYLAQSDINGSPGARRSGRWRLRVPVEDFQPFLEAALELGIPDHNTTDSQDLTAEYVDLEARIKNKKEQEETLRGYLKEKKQTSELKDILTIEQELGRVRGEVERLEGELRVMANVTALTTISLSVQEIKNYVPPAAPSFGTTVSRTFNRSKDLLVDFLKGCILVVVAASPWIPVALVVIAVFWVVVRISRSLLAGRPTTSPPPAGGTASA